jgi:very-short-patch-repair endonuclease
MHDIDRRVADAAARQHGLVTRAQLTDMGATDHVVRGRLGSGRLTVAGIGVLRVGGAPVTWESQVLTNVLAAGPGAVASHRVAAALWGLDGCRPGRPEVTVPRSIRYRVPGVRVHQSGDLELVAPVRRSGIPTTPVARTLLDLGAVVSPQRVHVALDDARRRRLTDWDALLATLVAHARKGRRGVGPLRAILDEHLGEVAMTGSGFERLVITRLRQAGLPPPVLQHGVSVAGRTYRLDLAYPDARLAVELDGSVHLRREVWEADHARQNALVLAGWTVLRFTWRDYLDRPADLVRQVAGALRAAAAA